MSNRAGIAKSKALALSAVAIVTAIVVRQMWLGNYYAELNEATPHALPAVTTAYDWNASRHKLEGIGAALQLYRKHVGIKPVAERKTLSDAGLPNDDVMSVLTKPGFAWSIDADAFRPELGATLTKATYAGDFCLPIESRRVMLDAIGPIGSPSPIHFVGTDGQAVRAAGYFDGITLDELPKWLQSRGEDLPVLVDNSPDILGEPSVSQPPQFALVLRLNGKVDRVPCPKALTAQSALRLYFRLRLYWIGEAASFLGQPFCVAPCPPSRIKFP